MERPSSWKQTTRTISPRTAPIALASDPGGELGHQVRGDPGGGVVDAVPGRPGRGQRQHQGGHRRDVGVLGAGGPDQGDQDGQDEGEGADGDRRPPHAGTGGGRPDQPDGAADGGDDPLAGGGDGQDQPGGVHADDDQPVQPRVGPGRQVAEVAEQQPAHPGGDQGGTGPGPRRDTAHRGSPPPSNLTPLSYANGPDIDSSAGTAAPPGARGAAAVPAAASRRG